MVTFRSPQVGSVGENEKTLLRAIKHWLSVRSSDPSSHWNPKTSQPSGNLLDSYLVGALEHFTFFHILGIIIQIDFHIFQRGWNHQPVIENGHF